MVAISLLYAAVGALSSWHGLIAICDSRLSETSLCQTKIARMAVAPWVRLHAAILPLSQESVTASSTSNSPGTIYIVTSVYQQAETLAPIQPQDARKEDFVGRRLRAIHHTQPRPVMVTNITWLEFATLPPLLLFLGILMFSLVFSACQGGFWTLAPPSNAPPPGSAVVELSFSGIVTQDTPPVSFPTPGSEGKELSFSIVSSQDTAPVFASSAAQLSHSVIVSQETAPLSFAPKRMSRSAILSSDTTPIAPAAPEVVNISCSTIHSVESAPVVAPVPTFSRSAIVSIDTSPIAPPRVMSSDVAAHETQTLKGGVDGMILVKEADLVEIKHSSAIKADYIKAKYEANLARYCPGDRSVYADPTAKPSAPLRKSHNKRIGTARKKQLMEMHGVSSDEVGRFVIEEREKEAAQDSQNIEALISLHAELLDILETLGVKDVKKGSLFILKR